MTTRIFSKRDTSTSSADMALQPVARLQTEAAMLEVAYADLEMGRFVSDDALDGWLTDWAEGREISLPEPPPSRSKR